MHFVCVFWRATVIAFSNVVYHDLHDLMSKEMNIVWSILPVPSACHLAKSRKQFLAISHHLLDKFVK